MAFTIRRAAHPTDRRCISVARGRGSCAAFAPVRRIGCQPTRPVYTGCGAKRISIRAAAVADAAVSGETKELFSEERTVGGGNLRMKTVLLPDGSTQVELDAREVPDNGNLMLHWGVSASSKKPHEWGAAPESVRPQGTNLFGDGKATRTPFNGGSLVVHVPADIVSTDDGPATLVGIAVRCNPGSEEQWLHADDGAGDLEAPMRPPPPPPPPGVGALLLARRSAEAESGEGMNLYRRYCLVNESIGEAVQDESPHSMATLLAWLRLSSSRQLDWYAGGNYQGKDMCHMQKVLSSRFAQAAGGEGLKAHLARMALAVLPRGGGEGDAIRMTILDLLRNNGIKEGHRPGIECPFLAQWHQKLHSNTTLDDIAIGEAYLHFLHGSGDWGDFWWFLWEHYKLTPEDLAAMKAGWRTQGITGPAVHLPWLSPAVQHLLWVIKVTHSGADMDTSMTMARGALPGDLQWSIDDMLTNRDEWWVPGKIVEIREQLSPVWRHCEDSSSLRSLLLLDISLESFLRTKIEATTGGIDGMSGDDAAALLELALKSHCITAGCTPEAANATALLQKILHNPPNGMERWSHEWSQHAVAVLDNVSLSVAGVLDSICAMVQEPANTFAAAVSSVDKKYVTNFGEEVARGHPLYVVSPLLQKLSRDCRSAAGLGPWQVIASGSGSEATYGRVITSNLADMQGHSAVTSAGEAAIVLSEELGGLEDIPPGVVAVLTASPVDLLSHIAIRARNSGVLLVSCADAQVWQSVVGEHGGELASVSAGPGSGDLTLEALDPSMASAARAQDSAPTEGALAPGALRVAKPEQTSEWVIVPADFREGLVGGKSMGLVQLAMLAGEDFLVPPAFAVPYGSFERALASSPQNVQQSFSDATSKLAAAAPHGSTSLDMEALRQALSEVRAAVGKIQLPADLQNAIASCVAGQGGSLEAWGLIAEDSAGAMDDPESAVAQGAGAWRALKAVWASKWTERAFLQRRSAGIPEESLSMAVLCMGLVPAEYAFVLHTASPFPGGSTDDVYGEVVVGLGETLVGNHPGRAFAFRASKSSPGDVSLLSLPSKVDAQYAPERQVCLIARSDSNGEDLEAFAGAGLYESHTSVKTAHVCANYVDERLLWDGEFRNQLVQQLVMLAKQVESSAGTAQDIEGCVSEGNVYLLQSRAQV